MGKLADSYLESLEVRAGAVSAMRNGWSIGYCVVRRMLCVRSTSKRFWNGALQYCMDHAR